MAKNTSNTLGEHSDSFIASQINTGRYGSASEVVRAGLRPFVLTNAAKLDLKKTAHFTKNNEVEIREIFIFSNLMGAMYHSV